MKYSVLEFIISETLRSQLQNKVLPPAVECILISQDPIQPLGKKLEALQERYDAYSEAQFAEGIYHISANRSFKELLGNFIIRMREEMNPRDDESGSFIYICDDGDYHGGSFDFLEKAMKRCVDCEYGRAVIIKQKINEPGYPNTVYVMNTPEINRIFVHDENSFMFDLPEAFAEMPHDFHEGDIIYDKLGGADYLVIVNAHNQTENPDWLAKADFSDMKLECLGLYFDRFGGRFCRRKVPLINAELVKSTDFPREYLPLRALSLVIQKKVELSDFLIAYSNESLAYLIDENFGKQL